MMRRRKVFNPKRRIQADCDQKTIERLVAQVSYGGNPEHKRDPGDFALVPPAQPRADKTLCDEAGVHSRVEAQRLVEAGIRRGLVSEQWRGRFPQNFWSVTVRGDPLEAQLTSQETGEYHGYPMPETDPFREEVLERWFRS